MFTFPPIPQALSPGSSLVVWQGRLPGRVRHPLPIIEILPGNHADVTMNHRQQRELDLYDRQGLSRPGVRKGAEIDLYC
jgi:hypothetical protein